jgi:predicted nucleic acid-binding protein
VKEVFVDSLYWIALTNPGDQWHRKAVAAKERRPEGLVTTEDVLVDDLLWSARPGSASRC